MRAERQHSIDRAVIRVLANCGAFLCPEPVLRAEVAWLVVPRPTASEVDDSIRHLDALQCFISVAAPAGMKWKLSDVGRAWHAENN